MGLSTIDRLMLNAYMLSGMSDSPFLSKRKLEDLKDDVSATNKIDRCVALILKKEKDGNFTMVNPSVKRRLIDHLADEFKLTEDLYKKVVTFAKGGSKKLDGMPAFATAVQHLKVWILLIQWSCDFASSKMNSAQVKTLAKTTKDTLVPMFDVVRTETDGQLGLRNFIGVKSKHTKKGSEDSEKSIANERLDLMLIEYRDHLIEKANTATPTPKEPKCLVIGIPKRPKWKKMSEKARDSNKDLKVPLPNYGGRLHQNMEFGDKGDNKVHSKGTLDEQMIRRLWEIARLGKGRLTSHTHKAHVPRKDNTVPVLVKKNDDNVDVAIHEHYIGNLNSMDAIRKHLRQHVEEKQLATLVVDYPWVDKSKGKDCEMKYTESKLIRERYSKNMFSEVIPMLARMSFLSDDGEILLPHHPWIMTNLYNNENKYRCLYDIDFVNEKTIIDKAHGAWTNIAEGSYSCKGDQRQYHLDQDMRAKKNWLYEKMISHGESNDKAVQLYAEQWDFVPAEEIEKIRWVRLKPKTIDLATKLSGTKKEDKSECCIRPKQCWSKHKEDVEKVEQELKQAQQLGSEQPTLILGLAADKENSGEKRTFHLTETGDDVNYDEVLGDMIGDREQKKNLFASTLLRWSVFRALHKKNINVTVKAFAFRQCPKVKTNNVHHDLTHSENEKSVVRNYFGDWN